MNNDQITALAREFSREHYYSIIAYQAAKDVIHFLLRRYCLVEKSRLEKLDIAYRAKEYEMVILDKGDVNFLFPEIAKEVEEPKTNHRSHENSWCENEL